MMASGRVLVRTLLRLVRIRAGLWRSMDKAGLGGVNRIG